MNHNLPPGVLLRDIDGPPMPRCGRCGQEFTPERDEALCDECQPAEPDNEDAQEILRALRRDNNELRAKLAECHLIRRIAGDADPRWPDSWGMKLS